MNKLFLSGIALLIVNGCSQGLSEKEMSAAKVQADNLCILAETDKDFAQKMADIADVHAVTHANSPSQQSELRVQQESVQIAHDRGCVT